MKAKLKRLQDILVIICTLEVVLLVSILLFNQDIIGHLWNVLKVNMVAAMFYGWAWLMEAYFDDEEGAAKNKKYFGGAKEKKVKPPKVEKEVK